MDKPYPSDPAHPEHPEHPRVYEDTFDDDGNLVESVEIPAAEQVPPDEPVEAPEQDTPDYEGMTKDELLDLAEKRGVYAVASWTKAEIIDALNAPAEEPDLEETPA